MYKYASEVVQHLNSSNSNIYEMSEQMGMGRTSLRRKLINLGYELNPEGKWVFTGNHDDEPLNVNLTQRLSLKRKNNQSPKQQPSGALAKEISLYEAVMSLNNDNQIRTTIVVDKDLVYQTKQLAERTKLKLSDLYSLALHELVEKYDPK